MLREGIGAAATGIGFNTTQVIVGGTLGILLTCAVVRAYPPVTGFGERPTWREEARG